MSYRISGRDAGAPHRTRRYGPCTRGGWIRSTFRRRHFARETWARSAYHGCPLFAAGASRRSADLISVADEVARSIIPREGLHDLACNPLTGRVKCCVDPDKLSACQPDDDKERRL